MALEVGSMLIKAKFDSGNIISGLSDMTRKLKESALTAKSGTTAFMRMKGTLIGLTAAAGLSGAALLGMLTNAVMQSPFLAAALEKLKNEFMLFGNAIAKHVAPILEKVVDLIRWLRKKFEALPDPMQSVIVKGILLSGVVLTLIFGLGLLKTALSVLGLTSVAAKLGTLVAAITGSAAAVLLMSIATGLLLGGLAVLVLDKIGVIQWFEDLGASIEFTDRRLRDFLIAMGTVPAVMGAGVIDILTGTPDWKMARQTKRQGEEAAWRYRQGVSEHYGPADERMHSEDLRAPKTKIENQNVEIHNDFSGMYGDLSDPVAIQIALDRINKENAKLMETLNV